MSIKLSRLLLLLLLGATLQAKATPADNVRTYSEAHPLVYEDVWDLWPYSFLNENGKPDGFNVDLIRMLMKELDIPYVIKMKSANEAFRDLRDGKSDLMLGLAVGFHDEFGHYSKNAVTLFTQSVVAPKGKATQIRRFHDLSDHKVIVNDSSLCHHLMIEYGWGANALPVEDMREAIQEVSAKGEGMIVWNTLSLKWLMRRYHTDNLELLPVNMQHGQYKFMSNDTHLLDRLDEAYTRLYSAEQITPIQNKWFYPERLEQKTAPWIWYVTALVALVMLITAIYGITYRVQARRLTRENERRNSRLALILHTSHVHIWTYDINAHTFDWRNEAGKVACTYTIDEFSQRYEPGDFQRLKEALDDLSVQEKSDEEKEITLQLKARDMENGDKEVRDYLVALSVLIRDKQGKPTVIVGTKKDITDQLLQQRLSNEKTLRYWSIFYNPLVGILFFDREGVLTAINPCACKMFGCDKDDIIREQVTLDDIFDTGTDNMEHPEDFYATQIIDFDRIPATERKVKSIKCKGKLYNEVRLLTVTDEQTHPLGVFAVCHDVSAAVMGTGRQHGDAAMLESAANVLKDYNTNIDRVLQESDVRLVTYSPSSHTLTILNRTDHVQHALTQTRCMTLVDDRSKKQAMRMLNDMDEGADRTFHTAICTTLRVHGRRVLNLLFYLCPVHDSEGLVTSYYGLCRDISEQCQIAQQMELETAKVQEVENTKNSFVKNMVQEIRKPMNTVIDHVAQLGDTVPVEHEELLREGILRNSDYLLHLIDNILYLSRLEAHMVEINRKPSNFAEQFGSLCQQGWEKYENAHTRYVVENPYEQLEIDIDMVNIGHAIRQVTANAAQHTESGVVRARYEYIGRRLIITVDDTGEGMPADVLAHINDTTGSASNTKGLGLAICHELVSQMGGTLEISSEEGSGTTVYMTIPCQATVIKRRKLS